MLSLDEDYLLSLTEKCPLETYLADCPFAMQNKSDSFHRREWIKSFSEDELSKLNLIHAACLNMRMLKSALEKKDVAKIAGLNHVSIK